MLGIMRKYKQSIIIKGVFTIIVLSFVGTMFLIWGEGQEGLQGSNYALKINGEKISNEEFLKTNEKVKEALQRMYGQPITPEMEKQLSLKKMTIERILTTTLSKQEAKRMGLKVSDTEVIKAISEIPLFQKNGAFDTQQYEMMLRENRFTPAMFENAMREDLLMKKIREEVTKKVAVSDAEAHQEYKKMHDRVDLQFVSFAPNDVRKEVKATEQELNAYLQQHQKEFKTQEEISFAYVLLTPEKVAPTLTLSDEEIQNFYQKNIDRYQDKGGILPFEQAKDRAKADALRFKASKQAYEMAATALNKNLKTGDINAVAKTLGVAVVQTPQFSVATAPADLNTEVALVKRAFALPQGELGGPVETAKGVYLFKVTARKPATVPPLAKVRGEVEKRVVDEKAFALARKKASDAQALLAKGGFSGTLQDTGPFPYSEKGDVPRIGTSREILEAAFSLTSATPAATTPYFVNGRWYAIRLKNRIAADMAGFQKEKEQIKKSLLPKKQQDAIETWMKGLRAKAKIVKNPSLETE